MRAGTGQRSSLTRITTDADVVFCSLRAGEAAARVGLGRTERQKFATAVSELARNIVRYAGGGEVRISEVQHGSRRGVEATAEDRGPGIEDVELAMSDRFSTGESMGLGLPGTKRMVDDFEIESEPGHGTRVTIRKWQERR